MTNPGAFVAQLLETSAAGYAGLSTSLLLERNPQIAERYEPNGFAGWKAQFQRWLLDLSAALAAGEPKLFEARMIWTREAFLARGASSEDLPAALEALRDVLLERLPENGAAPAIEAVDRARKTIREPVSGGKPDLARTAGQPALSYLATILEGRPGAAIRQLLRAVDDGTAIQDLYLNVLIPAQRETGRLWHAGELSIAEEHVVTTTTRRAMAILSSRTPEVQTTNRSVLLACVAGNVHDIGINAIADFFEMSGWRSVNLGTDVPDDEIVKSVQLFDVDLVVLAATLDPHLKAVQRTIERIRALEDRNVKIIVGGPVFEAVPELWRKIGADGYAASIEDTEPLGSRLVEQE